MRKCILLFLLFVVTLSYGQIKNTYIDSVGVMNIYGNGKVVIGKAIINQTLKTKVLLISSEQSKDSSGIYTTTFRFGNKETIPLFGVDLSFKFSDSVISANWRGVSSALNILESFANDKKSFSVRAGQINRDPFGGDLLMEFTIKSKKKITITIQGIDGKFG